ncbi:hypothetical protein K501DRAFT_237324 [Backusella circina FSU 941]|nr:hypothetical protein K501DRAFT_237324 [Backusella circina FSU 941]
MNSSLDTFTDKNKVNEEEENRKKLHYPTPLPPIKPDSLISKLEQNAIKYIIGACLLCYASGRFGYNIFFGLILGILSVMAFWNLGREAKKGVEWQLEKQEAIKTLYTSEGESVEWLNFMVEKVWRSIDPEFFTLIEDILEDTLQSVSPGFIKAIKVYDFDIGVQAPRINMIRIFPPLPGQPEESIFGEAAFSFHANPVASLSSKRSTSATPPGLSIRFKTALKAPLDVKAELTSLSGKLRFKLLTAPDLPFISKATIAFTSMPTIETAVMPLSKHLNIMNLPTIKTLVNEGVKLGFSDFIDPKSLSLDIKSLLGPGATDTDAIGVIKAEIREAICEKSKNLQDMEDSYATISLSTQPKKTISSTRVLTNDKNPRWNENLYVLLSQDDIISETSIDIKVWDADKVKFDDTWGSISMSVKDAVEGKLDKLGNVESWSQKERVIFDGWSPIDGKSQDKSKIKLNMKLSFHPKYPTANMDIFSNVSLKKSTPEQKKERENQLKAPVEPDHNNGVLSIQIHQAADLEIGDPEILPSADEFKHPYDHNKIVNPYALLYINDSKVYQTRTKLRNPTPHWNTISEHFIKNFNTTSIRISVKTSVDLERDPVLGMKVLSLSQLFDDQDDKFKEVQKWLPLSNGIGFGKVLVTLKYKPVKMFLPRELQGADVGTLMVDSVCLKNLKPPFDIHSLGSLRAVLALNVDPVILKRLKPRDITGLEYDPNIPELPGWYHQHLYFPLTMRYRTSLYVHIIQGSFSVTKATGRIWLKYMPDNEWIELNIGLHPYLPEKSKEANRNEDPWSEDGELGSIIIRAKIVPGFSPVHTHLRSYIKDMVGADPFYDNNTKDKAQKWIKAQNSKDSNSKENLEDSNLQNDIELEKAKQSESDSVSSEYGDDSTDEDTSDSYESDTDERQFEQDLVGQGRKNKIHKHRAIRKLSLGVDKIKHKVNVFIEGFNSETRANRSVAKEV